MSKVGTEAPQWRIIHDAGLGWIVIDPEGRRRAKCYDEEAAGLIIESLKSGEPSEALGTDAADAAATAGAPNERGAANWRRIATVPKDVPVILANFSAMCLLTGVPHVWAATYVTEWSDGYGDRVDAEPMWCEASFAAMNENGSPTHWMPLPETPDDVEVADRQARSAVAQDSPVVPKE